MASIKAPGLPSMRFQPAEKGGVMLLRILLLLLLTCSLAPARHVLAEETAPAEEAVTTSTAAITEIPTVFRKRLPESLDDLKAIEAHITKLVPKLTAATVNIQVGPAQGSGVIVSDDGLVLTAAHVVGRPGRRVKIVLADGKEVRGETLGRDRMIDAAVVRIVTPREEWPKCELAPAGETRTGDWCIATGHPGGYQEDRGVVVRVGRVILGSSRFIQTDCELVGGDSGGPLFDMYGRVIGINSRIGEETSVNIHVPVEGYHSNWDRLLAGEDFASHSGAFLGISGTADESGKGLRITRVFEGSPADEAGLKVGDVLATFQARPVRDIERLIDLVGDEPPGKKVRLEVLRDEKRLEVEARLTIRWD